MSEQYEVRKLPIKTKIIFIILSIIAIVMYFMQENTKVIKANKILQTLGYTNISNLKVYSKNQVEDKITKVQGNKYFIKFVNNNTKEECRGFILKNFKRETAQDLTCERKVKQ